MIYHYICKKCQKPFTTQEKDGQFCGHSCSASYHNLGRKHSAESKANVAAGLKKYYKEHPEKVAKGPAHAQRIGALTRGKFRISAPESMLQLSKRTVSKIVSRLKLKCTVCGWNEAACDVHHIHGRKIKNADSHDNLTVLCPNHHRLAHSGKLHDVKLTTLTELVGDSWKQYYFG
ncbi:MAG: HNH endonuclease [Nitrosomonadaceae bacterium]|nr:HNH endonuclease [Nitrosomonadaceae bacterium]